MNPSTYDSRLLNEIAAAADSSGDIAARAKRVAQLIRAACGCVWVGFFKITETEAVALGWTGNEAPAFLSFPLTRGITRDVVKTRKTAVVNDVLKDARYLVAFSTTRAEVIVPVTNSAGAVIGTMEADSDKVNAFTTADVQFFEQCAARLSALFE